VSEPLPEVMTVAEIAAILKLNQQTVRNWIDAGKLPHVRIGERRVRVYRRDFDAFVARGYGGESEPLEPRSSIWDGVISPPQ
jgi:excisionase family DNA binding protein